MRAPASSGGRSLRKSSRGAPRFTSMNVSELFIRRPVATCLLMFGVILLGMLGYVLLPVSALPPVDFPTI